MQIWNVETQNLAIWHLASKASVPGPGPACRFIEIRRLTPREDRLLLRVPSTLRGMFSSVCNHRKHNTGLPRGSEKNSPQWNWNNLWRNFAWRIVWYTWSHCFVDFNQYCTACQVWKIAQEYRSSSICADVGHPPDWSLSGEGTDFLPVRNERSGEKNHL